MERLFLDLGERAYHINIGAGILDMIGELSASLMSSSRNIIISNPHVFSLFGKDVLSSLMAKGIDCKPLLIPDGEQYKDMFWLYHILSEMLQRRLDRNSCLIALGGGVIGDMTGFAASVYMRGIKFIQIPTTLLAQVDSSVGGKTGVNHSLGKNMIGSFYQPSLVIIDTDTLATLPGREFKCGMGEVLKYGVISDSTFFDFLEDNRTEILRGDKEKLSHIISTSCRIKAKIVSQDERESGLRAVLNYGHTVGHAIETETGYSVYKHGEAVAIGMCMEASIAYYLNLLARDEFLRIVSLIEAYGLPSSLPDNISIEALVNHMRIDKKSEDGRITIITPRSIGRVEITKSVAVQDILSALKASEHK